MRFPRDLLSRSDDDIVTRDRTLVKGLEGRYDENLSHYPAGLTQQPDGDRHGRRQRKRYRLAVDLRRRADRGHRRRRVPAAPPGRHPLASRRGAVRRLLLTRGDSSGCRCCDPILSRVGEVRRPAHGRRLVLCRLSCARLRCGARYVPSGSSPVPENRSRLPAPTRPPADPSARNRLYRAVAEPGRLAMIFLYAPLSPLWGWGPPSEIWVGPRGAATTRHQRLVYWHIQIGRP